MKKRICVIGFLILLTQVTESPFFASEVRADTRITVTFAAGGAACGAYFFFRFAFRGSSLMDQDQNAAAALVNYDPEGWHINVPSLNLIRDEHPALLGPKDAPGTAYLELMRLRF